jgi:hypothetical protein
MATWRDDRAVIGQQRGMVRMAASVSKEGEPSFAG